MPSPPPIKRHNLDELTLGEAILTWEQIHTGFESSSGWMHSGIAVLGDDSLVIAHPEGRQLIRVDQEGNSSLIPTDLTEMHCIAGARHRSGQVLWIADNGHRFVYGEPTYGEVRAPGRAVALTLDGTVAQELQDPQINGPWSPTSVAVVESGNPDSDLWVADGYGQNLVHRYSAQGRLLQTIDGTATGKHFDCPHGVWIRGNNESAEVYVADRANRRLVGADALNSPSSMVDLHGYLFVTELFGALAVFDGDDYIGHWGSSSRNPQDPIWPNRYDDAGQTVAPPLHDRTFNSPHGITTHNGDLYLTEWLIGGRIIRLHRSE
ncbi:hypothetical protein [Kocuria rosea]|uniref:hypothetical protein n=1 Tax=Kocuria rosea TaxID=1275 RepID=UPI00203AC803|nr:hypothetical protein [Kocuria rosea]